MVGTAQTRLCLPYDKRRLMSETPPTIALLGVPIEIGAGQAGTLMGPAALRTAGIARGLEPLGHAIEDHGDMPSPPITAAPAPPSKPKYYDELNAWVRELSERAFSIARSGALP